MSDIIKKFNRSMPDLKKISSLNPRRSAEELVGEGLRIWEVGTKQERQAKVQELMESVGCTQNKWHAFDVWGHAMACLDACRPAPVLRVAALLHDVAKPRTRAFSDKTQDYTFYEHERVGAEMAEPILSRLRFSNEERARIVALVRHHLICYQDDWTDAAVRRWIRRITPELAPDLYDLGIADALGKGREASADIASIAR